MSATAAGTGSAGAATVDAGLLADLLEQVEEVLESIVVGQDWPPQKPEDVRVVLFVKLKEGVQLDDALANRIKKRIRDNTTSRHVPAKILQVADIPRRLAGRVAQICFRALEDVSQPIAVRVFAMTVLVNLCQGKKRYTKLHRGKEKIHEGGKDIGVAEPELAREVALAITTVLPYGTAAFTSRAKRELRRLERLWPQGSSHHWRDHGSSDR